MQALVGTVGLLRSAVDLCARTSVSDATNLVWLASSGGGLVARSTQGSRGRVLGTRSDEWSPRPRPAPCPDWCQTEER